MTLHTISRCWPRVGCHWEQLISSWHGFASPQSAHNSFNCSR